MNLEGTDFNELYWSKFSEQEFIKECFDSGLFKGYSDSDRKTLFTIAYKLIQGAGSSGPLNISTSGINADKAQ